MPFAEIVGHELNVRLLQQALRAGRVPPAYLFSGAERLGKASVALAWAQAVNCQAPQDSEACGECRSCRAITRGAHPDVRLVRPEASRVQSRESRVEGREIGSEDPESRVSGSIDGQGSEVSLEGTVLRTEQVLELVRDAHLRPVWGPHKVYILDRAEAMNEASANRLLKTLEEPPGQTTFILVSAQPGRLLPTIHSRCQEIRFGPIPAPALAQGLQRRFPDSNTALVQALAATSAGRFGWAQEMLQHPELRQVRQQWLELLASLPNREPFEALRLAKATTDLAQAWWLGRMGEEGQEALKRSPDRVLRAQAGELLELALTWYRDLLLLSSNGRNGEDLLVNQDLRKLLEECSRQASGEQAGRHAAAVQQQRQYILFGNANLRLALEVLFLRLLK